MPRRKNRSRSMNNHLNLQLRMNATAFIRTTAVILLALMLLSPARAEAHGYLVRAIPEDRAVLERAPVRVQYWFSESLERAYSILTIRDSDGNVIAEGGVDERDAALLSVRLPTTLPDGAYLSELRIAFASDGHVIYETRTFFVGVSADGGFVGAARSDLPVPLEILWRSLMLPAQILLFGVFAAYALVFVPAWGNRDYPEGLLPPRVMRRLTVIAWAALILAFTGNILALLQATMAFFNADLGRVISDNLWSIVRTGTRFGDTWNWRMLLLIGTAGLLLTAAYFKREYPWAVKASWTAGGWLLALVMGTMSISSHAAGSLTMPWAALFSDWIHGMGVGIWAGGAAVIALVLPVALKPLTGDEPRIATLAALSKFTRIAAAGMFVVVATGIYSASNWITEPDDVPTPYGGTLAIKILLVALLISIGAAHHITLRPERYQRFAAVRARVGTFIPTLRLEAVFVLLVLISVAFLSSSPVPPLSVEGQSAPPPSETQTINGLDITVTITPGGPGVNTFDVLIKRAGVPVDDADVTLQNSSPSRDIRGAVHFLENVGGGLYVGAAADIDQQGEWWTRVTIDHEQISRAAYRWMISAEAAVIQSRPPSLLNIGALLAVIAALIYAASSPLTRYLRLFDFSPAAVTVAVVSITAGIALLIATVIIINETTAEYDQAINPPPEVINPILPTDASVTAGNSLASQACAWLQAERIQDLIDRLPRTRDEALFRYTYDGWETLPPCAEDLSETDRWNIVNGIRAYEPYASIYRTEG